jgi:hypothetical protein
MVQVFSNFKLRDPRCVRFCCGSFELSFQDGEMVSLGVGVGYKGHLDGWGWGVTKEA